MYEPSPYEDSRGLRLAADEDFMRSLDQLEDLLEKDLIAATAEHLRSKEQVSAPIPESTHQTGAEPSNRFGGSLFDAIPLVERLADRLAAERLQAKDTGADIGAGIGANDDLPKG